MLSKNKIKCPWCNQFTYHRHKNLDIHLARGIDHISIYDLDTSFEIRVTGWLNKTSFHDNNKGTLTPFIEFDVILDVSKFFDKKFKLKKKEINKLLCLI